MDIAAVAIAFGRDQVGVELLIGVGCQELDYFVGYRALAGGIESRSLGYAHWPEPSSTPAATRAQSRSLGYAHWPEQNAIDIAVSYIV